jgi:hypothetical protein
MALTYNVAVLTGMLSEEITRRGRGAQTRLAEAVGVPVQTINKWVHGQTHPDPARWELIEHHFEWEDGEIARRVMPALGSDSTYQVMLKLAEQVEALGRRVETLERRVTSRAARGGK